MLKFTQMYGLIVRNHQHHYLYITMNPLFIHHFTTINHYKVHVPNHPPNFQMILGYPKARRITRITLQIVRTHLPEDLQDPGSILDRRVVPSLNDDEMVQNGFLMFFFLMVNNVFLLPGFDIM